MDDDGEESGELQSTQGAPLPRSRTRGVAPARAPAAAAVARARLRFMFRANISTQHMLEAFARLALHDDERHGRRMRRGRAATHDMPLARRAPSAASPQRSSPSLSSSLALSLALFLFVSWSSQVRSARPPIGDCDGSDGDFDDRLELRARAAAASPPPPPLPGWATGDAEIDR